MLVHSDSIDLQGNGGCGETFYITVSSKEYERISKNDYKPIKRKKGFSELKITQSEQVCFSGFDSEKKAAKAL